MIEPSLANSHPQPAHTDSLRRPRRNLLAIRVLRPDFDAPALPIPRYELPQLPLAHVQSDRPCEPLGASEVHCVILPSPQCERTMILAGRWPATRWEGLGKLSPFLRFFAKVF